MPLPVLRKGYTFGGWYTDVEYQNKIGIIEQGTTGNGILYAKWDEIASGSITASVCINGNNSVRYSTRYDKCGRKGI